MRCQYLTSTLITFVSMAILTLIVTLILTPVLSLTLIAHLQVRTRLSFFLLHEYPKNEYGPNHLFLNRKLPARFMSVFTFGMALRR